MEAHYSPDTGEWFRTDTGERIGAQRPTNCFIPEAANDLAARKALWILDAIGFGLDPWQKWSLGQMLGRTEDDRYAARDVCLLVPRQNGKCLDCETEILTANRGWTTMKEIRVGDEVFHPDGTAIAVEQVHEIKNDLQCYRVTTTDGRSVIADAEHLWTVTDKGRPKSKGPRGNLTRWFEERTVTTQEIFDSGLQRYSGRANGRNEYRYQLPRQQALSDLPKADLPIDPYLLGAWLGDGSSKSAELTCHESDVDHWTRATSNAGFVPVIRRHAERAPTVSITTERGAGKQSRSMVGKLRQLDLLCNKHIPEGYLTAADWQREALLQGLLDTDGCCNKNGQVEFCSMNKGLAEGVLFLARSLGWRATLHEGRAICDGKDCGTKYRVTWTPTREDPYECFRMDRKLANVKSVDGGAGRFTVSISSVEPVESVPVRCIKVASEDGLFLAGRDLIATHNTRILEARALAGILVLGEEVIFTAQQFGTCRESFFRVKAALENYADESGDPDFQEPNLKFRESNDYLSIIFHGKRIVYKARGTNPVRGFSPQVIIADEAYAMTDEIAAALQNALRAQKAPQYICTSSTGLDDSDYLLRMRDRGMTEKGEHSLALMEWCANAGCDLDDIQQWWQSNPALGIRVDMETMENDRRGQADKQFGRECLGLWADNKFRAVIDHDLWVSRGENPGTISKKYVVAIDAAPDGSRASLALAGYTDDGRKQIEILHSDRDMSWCVDKVARLYRNVNAPTPLGVCVQGNAKAGALIPELEAAGAEVIKFSTQDVATACGFFFDSVMDGTLSHLNDPFLAAALSGATRIMVGKLDGPKGLEEYRAWYWGRKDTLVDITGLCASTYALWGLNVSVSEAELNKPHWYGKPRGGGIW